MSFYKRGKSNNENKTGLFPPSFFFCCCFQYLFFVFISGNGAQFQIRVVTTAANAGAAGSGFDLIYSQVGCS